jgi:hypothetical protein
MWVAGAAVVEHERRSCIEGWKEPPPNKAAMMQIVYTELGLRQHDADWCVSWYRYVTARGWPSPEDKTGIETIALAIELEASWRGHMAKMEMGLFDPIVAQERMERQDELRWLATAEPEEREPVVRNLLRNLMCWEVLLPVGAVAVPFVLYAVFGRRLF